MGQSVSPLTGILEEDKVFVDFGEHEGKSILEIADRFPEIYASWVQEKESGNFSIRRNKEKIFKLYISQKIQ